MRKVTIRELKDEDGNAFITAMQRSKSLHLPWVKAPTTDKEFEDYFKRYQQPNQKSFLVFDPAGSIVGIFNINEMVRNSFQNAYLGFYAVADYAGKGYMSAGLKLVLTNVFNELKLHRIEANIQPANSRAIELVKKNGFRYEGFSPRYLKVDEVWCGHEHWAMTAEDYIRDDKEVLNKDRIEIVPYNQEWSHLARIAIEEVRANLPRNCVIDIQHVGSTAIPGLSAKPIIDIQVAVRSLEEMKVIAVAALQKIGYEYWADNPDPERMFFVKGMPPYGEKRTHHVHMVEPTSKHWEEKLLFKDYLIAHPEVAQEYEQLKIKLAQQYTSDRERYTDAKSEFIKKVIELAKKRVAIP
jgi:GrpB-like predicted nucleotidyltransferase (UPF0157 family)/RimJ/RimL family protein N-acetyltransferase